MKRLEDMNEPELRELTNRLCGGIQDNLPPHTAFVVIFGPFGDYGVGQYGANCRRAEAIQWLRETADRLEKRQDVPR